MESIHLWFAILAATISAIFDTLHLLLSAIRDIIPKLREIRKAWKDLLSDN